MSGKDKRSLILEAAEKVFANKRFHELTLDDVAKEANVGKGTIYRYFKNKDDLVYQLATHGHDELCELIHEYTKLKDVPFAGLLEAVCSRISEFFLGRHSLFRVMGDQEHKMHSLRNTHRKEFEAHRKKMIAAMAKILENGKAQKIIRDDIDLEVQAQFLLGMMRTRDHSFGYVPSEMPPIKMVVDIFLNGTAKAD
jgi:AcrR family transcriptional regulator